MEIVLLIATLAVRRQSAFETSAAPLLFMCLLLPVLVRWQLDTHKITMHSSSGATQQDVAQNDLCFTEKPMVTADTHI